MFRRLDRAFFQVTDLRNLSLFRAVYCTVLAVTVALTFPGAERLYAARIYNPIPLFEVFHIGRVGAGAFQGLCVALAVSLLFAAIGLFTRPALVVSTALYFLYFGTRLGFTKASGTNYVYHSENMAFFVLLVLSASPKVWLWGLDGKRRRGGRWAPEAGAARGPAWALPLLATLLGLAYFGSAWCKLMASPLWADGYTLQAYLAIKHLLVDTEIGFRLAQSWWLCLALGIAALVMELGFWTVVFFPRRAWIYALSGLAFHIGILVTMHINFLFYHGYTYLLFIFWPGPGSREPVPPAADAVAVSTAPVSRGERIFVYGMILVFLGCDLGRVESWPFSDFRVYEQRNFPQRVRVYRVAGIDAEGRMTWIPTADLPRSEATLNAEFVRLFSRKDEEGARKFLAEIASTIEASKLTPYKSLGAFARTLNVAPDGTLSPADALLFSVPISPSPAR